MRFVNRVLALLLSIALIAGGVLLIIEVIADRINHRPALVHWRSDYRWLGVHQWQAGSVRVACAALVLVGLVLLIAELRRKKVGRLRTGVRKPANVDTAYTRRGVTAAVRSAVTTVDGIRSAQVTVKRRSIKVDALTSARDQAAADKFRDSAQEAVESRVAELELKSRPKVVVKTLARST